MQQNPNWHVATTLGLSLWRSGDTQGAEKAFEAAIQMDPEDISARLEAGDMFLDSGEWQRSLNWYDDVLSAHPQHSWAHPSSLYCRWRITSEERYANDLIELAKRGDGRARQLSFQMFDDGLPEPVDATANVLRKLTAEIKGGQMKPPNGFLRMKVTGLEAPSNFLAIHLQMKAFGAELKLETVVEKVATPDPRLPVASVKYLLWKYEGTDASPGLDPPSPDVMERMAALASMTYDEDANWAAASHAAEQLGPSRVVEILATMVHPPDLPEGVTALVWLPRVQLAAAQTAAQVDEGWEESVRREALFSILLGPSDWATTAAIRALARLGAENEAFAPDIHEAFQKLADYRRDEGFCCWDRTLYEQWLRLPHLFDAEREQLVAKLRELDKDEDDEVS